MNDLDAEEARLLGQVRRAWSPADEDSARVLAALNAALLPPPPEPLGAGSSDAAKSAVGAKALRYFLGVSALGVAVLSGYGWGFHAGSSSRVAPAVAGSVSALSPAPRVPASLPNLVAAPANASSSLSELPPPSAGPSRAPSSGGGALRVPVTTPTPAAAPSAGLDEEVRQLRRIERALRENNPRLALVLAEDLDRTAPKGQLLLERRAASLMAACQLGAADASPNAARFLQENADSAYAPRVREMCELPQRTSAPAGTDAPSSGGKR